MENDDRQIGRLLTRREILALFGAAGATLLVGCWPEQSGSTPPPAVPTQTPAPTQAPAVPTPVSTLAAASTVALPACVVRPALTSHTTAGWRMCGSCATATPSSSHRSTSARRRSWYGTIAATIFSAFLVPTLMAFRAPPVRRANSDQRHCTYEHQCLCDPRIHSRAPSLSSLD